jgi:biotin carboxylase
MSQGGRMSDRHDEPGHALVLGEPGTIAPLLGKFADGLTMSCVLDTVSFESLPSAGSWPYRAVSVLPVGAPMEDWLALAGAVHKIKPLTMVCAFVERYLRPAAAIGKALGVPAPSEEVVRLVHHKPSMRQRLAQAGVENVAYRVVRDPDEAVAFGDRYGWPLVVKPARGTGSVGVSIVDNAGRLPPAFADAARPTRFSGGGVLVEQYLDGEQISVDAFSENGEHEILACTRSFTDHPRGTVVGLNLPVEFGHAMTMAVHEHIQATLTALRVQSGPTFTQLALTRDGPRVIEAHVRLPGDDTTEMYHEVSGVDLGLLWARQLAGQRVLPGLRAAVRDGTRGAGAIWQASPDIEGTLVAVEGVVEAAAMPGIAGVEQLVAPGDQVHPLSTNWDRGVRVRASGRDTEQAVAAARAAAERIVFVVNTGTEVVHVAHRPERLM